jgi:hypothetical protein
MIPKEVHFVWVGPPIPWWAHVNMERFRVMNPEFGFHLHGEEILAPEFRAGYDAIEGEHEFARKSDLLRLSALQQFGGWYFDCDFLPLRPLQEIYADNGDFPEQCFLTQGTPELVANGVIGVAQDAPFLAELVHVISAHAAAGKSLEWGSYGPALYTEVAKAHPGMVRVGAMDDFYPFRDRERSMNTFVALSRTGFAEDAIALAIGARRPYMMHVSMMDEQRLGGVAIQDGFPRYWRTDEEGTSPGLMAFYEYASATGRAGLGVEVGCCQGESGEIAAQYLGELVCVDSWDGGFQKFEAIFDRRLEKFTNIRKLKGPSHEIAREFPDGTADVVYIDAMHDYENVKRDVLSWFPKVRMGGYIAGHDYDALETHVGVVQAVDQLLGKPEKIFLPDSTWLFTKTEALCERFWK